ncbi:DUF6049 family protein [Demequina flava]|uniref:DUF6049 family protein n=1 Tax=Demequina flava TaxID=1095025 RepID=UPI0007850DB6|nr:DUF6049 family protein [Demequina flava]
MNARIFGAAIVVAALTGAATPAIAAVDAPEGYATAIQTPTLLRVPADVDGLVTSVTSATAQIDEDTALEVTASLNNTTASAMDEVVLDIALTTEPLTSSSALADFLETPEDFESESVVEAPVPADPADAGEGESEADSSEVAGDAGDSSGESDQAAADDEEPVEVGVTLEAGRQQLLTATTDDLSLGDAGVYGMTVSARVGDNVAQIDALPVTWTAGVDAELDLSVLVEADGTAPAVAQILGAAADPRVAVAADPSLITNANVLDGQLLEREVFWLPAGDPDIASLAHADDPRLLEFAVSRAPSASLASSIDAAWIAPLAVFDESSVAMASNTGAVAVMADEGAVGLDEALDAIDGNPVVTVGGETPVPALMADEALTEAFATYRPGTPAHWSRIVAETLLAADAGQERALIAPGDSWLRTAETADLITAMFDLPWVNPASVASLAEADAPVVDLESTLDTEADLDTHRVLSLGDQLVPLQELAAATSEPTAAYESWAAGLVHGVATIGRSGPSGRDIAYANALQDSQDVLSSLTIASGSDLNLLAQDGDVPITVENDLDWDATVTVRVHSNSPNLVVEAAPTVEVPANETQASLVPVSAVSSANVVLTAELITPDGVVVGEPQTYSVRVRADWGTAATLVFTGLLVLLLIAGVIRTIRRGRKDTRTDAVVIPGSDAPAAAVDETDESDQPAEPNEERERGDTRDVDGTNGRDD